MKLIKDIWPRIYDHSDFVDNFEDVMGNRVAEDRFWHRVLRRCIYGCWGHVGHGQYMYMNPYAYWLNWYVMEHTIQDEMGAPQTLYMRPILFDYTWAMVNYIYSCFGFAGFENDRYCCDPSLLTSNPDERWKDYNGKWREYVDPYTLLHMKRDAIPLNKSGKPARPLYHGNMKNAMVVGTRGGGKALRHGTPVLTPDGWFPVEQLRAGDTVTSPDGTPATVTGVFPQGEVMIWRVFFASGRYVDTCRHHQWLVRNRNGADLVVTTEDLWRYPYSFYCPMPRLATVRPPDRSKVVTEEEARRLWSAGYYVYRVGTTYRYVERRRMDPIIGAVPLYEVDHATCIAVDNESHTYVTKDYVVTHNSHISAAIIEHNFIFGGARSLSKSFVEGQVKMDQAIGTIDKTRLYQIAEKFMTSLDAKKDPSPPFDTWFGVRETLTPSGKKRIEPSFLFRYYLGNLTTNTDNKFRAGWLERVDGKLVERGTGSSIILVAYSPNKTNSSDSAAGGRFGFTLIEEAGLLHNLASILTSNKATAERLGRQFGVTLMIGTSNNTNPAPDLKRIFWDPDTYSVMPVKTPFGKHGFFLPAYMTWSECKDEHGNTDWDCVERRIRMHEEEFAKSNDPKVRLDFYIYYPCEPNHMWMSREEPIFDTEALQRRIKQIIVDRPKVIKGHFVGRLFRENSNLEVVTSPSHFDAMIRRGQYGCIAIYEPPMRVRSINKSRDVVEDVVYDMDMSIGKVPKDAYYVVVDPYTQGSLNYKGGSLGAAIVVKNPKYWTCDRKVIVATYYAKPYGGVEEFMEQVLQLCLFYGGGPQMLLYERSTASSGFRVFIMMRGYQELLRIDPVMSSSHKRRINNVTQYGFASPSGNRDKKIAYANNLHLLLNRRLTDECDLRVYDTIEDEALLTQLANFDPDENMDLVSAAMGIPFAIMEDELYDRGHSDLTEMIRDFYEKKR
ncbi:MAG: hypothetical protein D6746_10900 [Bacteroidetes bacterium]|nr:MAG: hypothetical protein D6746_10900 [Bacteroidota bacterium]